MSVSGLSLISSLYQTLQSSRSQGRNIQSEFQKLGQDLQAGNLTQATADFTTLSQSLPASLQAGNNSSLAQAFSAVGQALQSGNLSAAQQAYTTFRQDVRQSAAQAQQGIQSAFNQLGQDLQAGNVAQAQADYTTLSQLLSSSTQNTGSNPLAQAFSALGQALQSGNLSAAQTAFNTIQQDVQASAAQAANTTTQPSAAQTPHHHHHHHWGGSEGANSTATNSINQDFSALGQALQSGTLSAAQSAYTTLQQALQQSGWNAVETQSGAGQVSQTV
jgi:soluble cytochrome b562